jgi:hypothetical protein
MFDMNAHIPSLDSWHRGHPKWAWVTPGSKPYAPLFPSMSQPTPSMSFITCHPQVELLRKSVIFRLTYIMPTTHAKTTV